VHLVVILYHGVEQWLDAHGQMYGYDQEHAVGVEQFFYFQVKQRTNHGGTNSFVIDSQTNANLPLHKALYLIDRGGCGRTSAPMASAPVLGRATSKGPLAARLRCSEDRSSHRR
jgi:hypothetical protein